VVDLQSILADHNSRYRRAKKTDIDDSKKKLSPTVSEIPDIFFDHIIVKYKLTRIEILVLMYLYRRVWCKTNLYKIYGLSQLLSHTEMANSLGIDLDDVYHSLRVLEEYSFISTVRSGQYFVRKYFTKDNDEVFGQTYDDFEI
jgi:DNA-binding MarR family transcriptional regulator